MFFFIALTLLLTSHTHVWHMQSQWRILHVCACARACAIRRSLSFWSLYPITLAEMGTAIVFVFGGSGGGGSGRGGEGGSVAGAGVEVDSTAAGGRVEPSVKDKAVMKINLWSTEFQEDFGPLAPGCCCIACTYLYLPALWCTIPQSIVQRKGRGGRNIL